MKKLLLVFALILVACPASAQLIITAAYDGPLSGGVPKGVELYACCDIPDLSVYGLGSANNGGGSDGVEHFFPADAIAAGTTFYVTHEDSGNPTAFFDFFGFDADYIGDGYSMAINGDDAIELFYVGADQLGTAVVDVFGDINVDGNGTDWEYLDGWTKRNTQEGPGADVFTVAEWSFSGVSAWVGELTNAGSATPLVLGGYECNPLVPSESKTWEGVKSLYR